MINIMNAMDMSLYTKTPSCGILVDIGEWFVQLPQDLIGLYVVVAIILFAVLLVIYIAILIKLFNLFAEHEIAMRRLVKTMAELDKRRAEDRNTASRIAEDTRVDAEKLFRRLDATKDELIGRFEDATGGAAAEPGHGSAHAGFGVAGFLSRCKNLRPDSNETEGVLTVDPTPPARTDAQELPELPKSPKSPEPSEPAPLSRMDAREILNQLAAITKGYGLDSITIASTDGFVIASTSENAEYEAASYGFRLQREEHPIVDDHEYADVLDEGGVVYIASSDPVIREDVAGKISCELSELAQRM